MDELKKTAERLQSEVANAAARLDLRKLNNQLDSLRADMTRPDFWQDSKKAQVISRQESDLAERVEPWLELEKAIAEMVELSELQDSTMINELESQLGKLEEKLQQLKKDLRFRGEYDDHDVVLGIYAGAGGTDAQDWAQMLLRMYIRWAEAHKLKVETIDQSSGEEAGIKSVTLKITGGSYLYGRLAGEHGVHRLVRLSPFNADNLRQTSFAKVEVLPLIDKPSEVEIDDKDLKIETFRAGGHGGQSVNTTDSAVRITHLPTGLNVVIQNERSQLQNKETALAILRSRLAALQLEQHTKDIHSLKGPNQSAQWGNQIRNYVLHPYNLVKDLRSGQETSDTGAILNGEIDSFIDAWLEHNLGTPG